MRATYAALLCLLLAACEREQAVAIRFEARLGPAAAVCGRAANGTEMTDLRFFVHDVKLLTADRRAVPVTLDAAPPWQNNAVALIDLENGAGACDTGSPAMHAVLTGHVPAGTYTGLAFTLGVPFALNHADPVQATAPLDETVMHWHWQAGYKFLRAGIRAGARASWLHLGSTGCEGRIGAVTGCRAANRPSVILSTFNIGKDAVGVDLAALFGEAPEETTDHGCQSEPENPVCAPLLKHLGLGDNTQDVFRRVDPS